MKFDELQKQTFNQLLLQSNLTDLADSIGVRGQNQECELFNQPTSKKVSKLLTVALAKTF